MKLFSKLNLLTLALGGVLVLSVPAVKADTNNQKSTATLNIQDENTDTTAELSLDKVPSFPFNNVKAGTIFSGQSVDKGLTNDNNVVVTDTRLSNIGWNLAVTNTTAFVNGDSKINGTIKFTPSAFQFGKGTATEAAEAAETAEGWTWTNPTTSLALPNSTSNQVATSTGAKKGTATSTIQHATLIFNGHDAIVPGSYTANLTWNLTAATKDSSIKSE